jgi:signal transduction histidine kinase
VVARYGCHNPPMRWQVVPVLRLAMTLTVPIVVAAYVVATILGPLRPVRGVMSYPLLSPGLALLDVAAGVSLVSAGAMAWLFRRRWVGLLAMLAGVCWFATDWAGGLAVDPVIRATAMAVSTLTLPLLAGLVIGSERVRPAWVWSAVVLLLMAMTAWLAASWMLAYEGLYDARCLELCRLDPVGADPDHATARGLLGALLATQLATAIALAGWSAARLAQASGTGRRASGPILLPAIAVGLAWTAWALASMQLSTVTPALGPVMVGVFVTRSASTLALALGLSWVVLRAWRTLTAVRGIAWRLSPLPGGGSLRVALADAVGDPGLELRFPLPGTGDLVDPDGRVDPDVGGRAVLPIEHAGELVAIAITPAAEREDVARDLGGAVRLAAANERLLAAIRHEVHELRASRARIVQTGDDARYRLERDLHDGAQQQMLAVLYELALARDTARARGDEATAVRLDGAVAETEVTIEALRRIARGLHPALLTEAGLVAALDQLALEAPIPMTVDRPEAVDCGPDGAATAWRTVADTLGQAAPAGAEELRVRVTIQGASLRLELTVDGARDPLDLVPLEDRVGAGAGTLVAVAAPAGSQSIIVRLPCA